MSQSHEAGRPGPGRRLLGAGRVAWALLGIAGILVLVYLVLSRLSLVTVPVVLAFFVAGALHPLARAFRRLRLPASLAALLALLVGVGVIGGAVAVIVPAVSAQAPQLVSSLEQGLGRLQSTLQGLPGPPIDLGSAAGGLFTSGTVSSVVGTTATLLTDVVLIVVVAFFYLTEGRWLVRGVLDALPAHRRDMVADLAGRIWDTIGRYIRGILLVAFIDAVGIGVGLWLLGVPLALPLAVLVYLGAFVPVVGAFVAGSVAVLIAFASGGFWLALAAFGVVLLVQQLEGNVLQPLIMGRVIRLPAFVILVSVAVGGAWLGVLGAFLAVPVAAAVARIIEYGTGREIDTTPR